MLPIDLDPTELLQQAISFRLGPDNSPYTIFHGIIDSLNTTQRSVDATPEYHLVIRPRFILLNRDKRSRVFAAAKPMSIIDIIKQVLKDNGIADVQFELSNTYPLLTLCVQYQETDFNFLTRLMRKANLYYYFTHTVDKHTLVISDQAHCHVDTVQEAQTSHDTHQQAHITRWQSQRLVTLNSKTNTVYDFTQTGVKIESADTSPADHASSDQTKQTTFTQAEHGEKNQSIEASRSQLPVVNQRISASSNYYHWQAGTEFSLQQTESDAEPGDYTVYAIAYHAENKGDTAHYHNDFYAYPTNEGRTTKPVFQQSTLYPENALIDNGIVDDTPITQPVINGLQTAVVVGPKDKPIYTDKYGRIKVQFDWDAENTFNENSFAWVRVKQTLGSDRFGLQFIPRVGSTVVISFQQGDPNQPIAMGQLPTDTDNPPFNPKLSPTITAFRSRNLDPLAKQKTLSGHELVFDDNIKNPQLAMRSFHNMEINSQNNFSLQVKGKTETTIKQSDYDCDVTRSLVIKASQSIELRNHNSRLLITDSDIIIEADAIAVGKGAANAANISNINTGEDTAQASASQAPQKHSAPPEKSAGANDQNKTGNQANGYPSADVKIDNWESVLEKNLILYKLSVSSVFNANLKANNKNSVNPLTFNKEGFKIEAKNEVVNVFSNFKIANPDTILSAQPSISISNDYGDYEFELKAVVSTPNITQFTGTIRQSTNIYDGDWTITGEMSIDMTVTLTKNDSETGVLPSLAHDLEHNLDKVKQFFHTVFDGATTELQHATPVVAVAIITAIILTAPAGA